MSEPEWVPFDPVHDAPREMWDFSGGLPRFEFLAGADAPSGRFKKGDIVETHPMLMCTLMFTHYRRATVSEPRFKLGDPVRKISGSSWYGYVVGTYSTKLTPEGYCVESARHPGSVQIYPAGALAAWDDGRDRFE